MKKYFIKFMNDIRKTYLIDKLTIKKRKDINNYTELSFESKQIIDIYKLSNYLNCKKIPKKYYTIIEIKDDAICLVFKNIWLVFYSERGTEKIFFESLDEREACQKFLLILKKTIAKDTGRDSIDLFKTI